MNTPKILGIVRHVLTLLGGVAIAFGWLSEEVVTQGTEVVITFAGALLALIAFIMSFRATEKQITNEQYQRMKVK